jgi:hypothetical protein
MDVAPVAPHPQLLWDAYRDNVTEFPDNCNYLGTLEHIKILSKAKIT